MIASVTVAPRTSLAICRGALQGSPRLLTAARSLVNCRNCRRRSEPLCLVISHFGGFPAAAGRNLTAVPHRSLSNPMRHQAAWFFCDVTFVSMVAGGWLIQTLAGRGGGAGGRRNRLGLAA